jgi:hypothetical protein
MHTFIVQPGRWRAEGKFIDGTGLEIAAAGEAVVEHADERWLNRSSFSLEDEAHTNVANAYEIVPLADGAAATTFRSVNPALGVLVGQLALIDEVILMTFADASGEVHGSESLARLEQDRYRDVGMMFHGDQLVSSWRFLLQRIA